MGLEQWQLAAIDALLGNRNQWAHEVIEHFLLAVVGVQCDVDAVVLRCLMSKRSQRLCASDLVLYTQTGTEFSTTGGKLDDAVGFRFGEALQRCVDGLRGGAVDRGKRKAVFLGGVKHCVINFRSCDRHEFFLLTRGMKCH